MRLSTNERIIRKKVPLDSIVFACQEIEEDLFQRIEDYKNGVGDAYPMGFLLSEIEDKGWDPACRLRTFHTEPSGYSPFIVRERTHNGKIIYTPENGRHRFMALNILEIDSVDCFVARESRNLASPEQFRNFLTRMEQKIGSGQQYQTLTLPYGITWGSRDASLDIFHAIESKSWMGRTVLDVGTHIGVMAFEAKRYGADRVVGFDLDPKLIDLARELSKLLDLEIEFHCCDFWDFPLWGKEKFDVVMAHQCLYHFTTQHRCQYATQHTEDELLDLLSDTCEETFFAHTFVHNDDRPTQHTEGYRPTRSEVINDLKGRGFESVDLITLDEASAKRTVVAERGFSAPPSASK